MMIDLPDELATKLRAIATAAGMTLEAWLGKLATEPLPNQPRQPEAETLKVLDQNLEPTGSLSLADSHDDDQQTP